MTSASKFSALIEESKRLEETASNIQTGKEVGLSADQIKAFIDMYQSWFARCLSSLPEDLKGPFRLEYEKKVWPGIPLQKIKSFLEAPTKPSALHTNDDKGKEVFSYWQNPYETTFFQPLLAQRQLLLEAAERYPQSFTESEPVELVESLTRRFPLVCRQLRQRHHNRETLRISDEYDVQDLFHALLKIFFDDVRSEETVPSYAGGRSRTDFLLKSEGVVIEIKKTRPSLDARTLGEELIVDIARYKAHPDCKILIAFVYDPDGHIDNPRGIENDLSGPSNNILVKVIIVQS